MSQLFETPKKLVEAVVVGKEAALLDFQERYYPAVLGMLGCRYRQDEHAARQAKAKTVLQKVSEDLPGLLERAASSSGAPTDAARVLADWTSFQYWVVLWALRITEVDS